MPWRRCQRRWRGVAKLAKVVRFIGRQGQALYPSRAAMVPPVKALEDFRRQPLPEGEQQRIAQPWATRDEQIDRDGVPDLVRQSLKERQSGPNWTWSSNIASGKSASRSSSARPPSLPVASGSR
jgi:hypothetical protein